MEPFTVHKGKIAVLDQSNVDTDQIIPARFLSMVTRTGYGELLFKDLRGENFPLDAPEAKGASILVVGENFGCGSSREHAVWAIQQAGFRAVIARRTEKSPGFSDIFRQNAVNNGLLLIELSEKDHARLVEKGSGTEVTIDLPNQTVSFDNEKIPFDIHPTTKEALMKGLDFIGTTLLHEVKIAEYERTHELFVPPKKTP
ncbi:MAG TPA: 3-isopropylmalate dehydratase small subunit [Fimbriimonadales bacterium]|nr:3-isopropylmalate dehydratase small subunit [Fimbriimonadales bacterium]